jgi:uncharacterized protein (TIGR03000 family)
MELPADAQVWFDGTRPTQDGTYRRFVSPPLADGHTYTYHLRIASASNPAIDGTRTVSVSAGKRVNLDLRGQAQRGTGAAYYEPETGQAPAYNYSGASGAGGRSFAEQSPYGGYSWGPWPFPSWNFLTR